MKIWDKEMIEAINQSCTTCKFKDRPYEENCIGCAYEITIKRNWEEKEEQIGV